MDICYKCHQPITHNSSTVGTRKGVKHRSTEVQGYYGAGGLGCPVKSQFIANLQVAMRQGFEPEFCRTHEHLHKGKV